MTVLQIVPQLEVGGVERGTVDLTRGLVAKGHKVIVVSGGGRLVKLLRAEGIRHYELPVHKKSPWTMVTMIGKVAKIIEMEKPDIIHARSRVPAWIAFFATRRACNSRLWPRLYPAPAFITTAHGYYNQHFFSRVMGWGKVVIVPSVVIGQHMIRDFGVPAERIRLISRGVDLERFTFQPPPFRETAGEFTVGIIGRITPLKGHACFLRAVSKVTRVIPKLRVVIIGEAPPGKAKYKEELQLLVKRLGLSKCVEFLGVQKDIPDVLSRLDLLVSASTAQEAFGRSIIEAGACGVPVVATSVGGVTDIIEDRVNGLLVSPHDHSNLAQAIIEVFKNHQLTASLIKEARKKVEERFSLTKMIDSTVEAYEEAVNTFRILVIKLSAMGDVVLAIPSLRAIRKKFPTAWITVLVDAEYRAILQRSPYVNEVITYDRRRKDRGIIGILKLGAEVRKHCFDIAVDLQNNRRSHLFASLSFAPKRFGYHNGKLSFLLNYKVKYAGLPVDPVAHQQRTLALLGIELVEDRLELWPSISEQEWVDNFLKDEWVADCQPLVGINIGGSGRWVTKRWSIENFAKLSDELGREHIRVVITGTDTEVELGRKFMSATKNKPIVAVGKTSLLELAVLIGRCKVFVTSDSGPLHIAAAMGTPFVALFGPTDPSRHLPSSRDKVVIRKELHCSPCYKPKCKALRCMKQITVEEVLRAVRGLMNTSSSPTGVTDAHE